MLEGITWSQFGIVISGLVIFYYLGVILIYFRSETVAWASGKIKFTTKRDSSTSDLKKKASNQEHSIIGATVDDDRYIELFKEKNDPNADIFRKKLAFAEKSNYFGVNTIPPENDDSSIGLAETPILAEPGLSPEFIEKINAGLEDEPLETEGEEFIDLPLEDEVPIDADEVINLLEEGLKGVAPDQREAMENTVLYQELFAKAIQSEGQAIDNIFYRDLNQGKIENADKKENSGHEDVAGKDEFDWSRVSPEELASKLKSLQG
jgi:hypothetical protein